MKDLKTRQREREERHPAALKEEELNAKAAASLQDAAIAEQNEKQALESAAGAVKAEAKKQASGSNAASNPFGGSKP